MKNIIIEFSGLIVICFIISVLWKAIIILTSTGAIREIEKSEWKSDILVIFFGLIFFVLIILLFVSIIKFVWIYS